MSSFVVTTVHVPTDRLVEGGNQGIRIHSGSQVQAP